MSEDDRGREHLVWASYHQVFLAPVGVSPIYDGRDSGPLISVTDDTTALIIITGCADGPVLMATRARQAPPPATDADWEVQESVSIVITEPLRLSSPTWSELYEPVITPDKSGPHRVRVSARGRITNVDLSVATASEHYLIETWPEPVLRARETLRDDGIRI